MSIDFSCEVTQRGFNVTFAVESGSTLALLGRNGAGKSTVIELMAGLLRPDRGRIVVGGRTLVHIDGPAGHDVWVPAHRRHSGLVAQEPLLFPHLDATENAAFALRARGVGARAARERALHWLAAVGAEQLADRRPEQLSGGQAQRVALARALAADPAPLLLDEPLSALDVSAAGDVRQVLGEVLRDRTAVLVTHDVLDAVLLADRVAVLDAGRVVEHGPCHEVLGRPRTEFAADFAGLNLMRGIAVGPRSMQVGGSVTVHGLAEPPLLPGTGAVAVFTPSAVSVHLQSPGGSPSNIFSGAVTEILPRAGLVRVVVEGLSADVTPDSVARLRLVVGTEVHLAVKAAEVRLYPSEGREGDPT